MQMRSMLWALLFGALLSLSTSFVSATAATPANAASGAATMSRDFPPGLQIPAAARPGPGFDVDKATEAYLDLLTPTQPAATPAGATLRR